VRRRLDWCAVVGVPVVVLSAFLDPMDVVNGVIAWTSARFAIARRLGEQPAQRSAPPALPSTHTDDAAIRPLRAARRGSRRPASHRPTARRR